VRAPFNPGHVVAAYVGFAGVVGSGCAPASNLAGDSGVPLGDGAVDANDEGFATADSGDTLDADAGGCHPMSLAGFQPPAVVPSYRSLACRGFNGDGGLVQSYGDACIGHSSTYDRCTGFAVPDAAGAAECYRCLASVESPDASSYGAVVVATIPFVNYAGCVQLLDPTDAGASCAQTATATAICAEYACQAACPVTDQASSNAYTACWNEATSGACAGYWLRAQACLTAEVGDGGTPVGTICFAGSTAEDHYFSVAHYLCGGD
jgi:hypothetical protein